MKSTFNILKQTGLSLDFALNQCKLLDFNWHFDICERATWEDLIFHRLLINNLKGHSFVEHLSSIYSNRLDEKSDHCVSLINWPHKYYDIVLFETDISNTLSTT